MGPSSCWTPHAAGAPGWGGVWPGVAMCACTASEWVGGWVLHVRDSAYLHPKLGPPCRPNPTTLNPQTLTLTPCPSNLELLSCPPPPLHTHPPTLSQADLELCRPSCRLSPPPRHPPHHALTCLPPVHVRHSQPLPHHRGPLHLRHRRVCPWCVGSYRCVCACWGRG